MIIIRIKYKSNPGKPVEKTDKTAYATRTTVGSMLKYSAIPAQTPASILLLLLVNLFSITIEFLILLQSYNFYSKYQNNFVFFVKKR